MKMFTCVPEVFLYRVVTKSALGKAIHYCKNQWHKLIRYIDDGNLSIDNNRAERAVKPFVIGRKIGCSQTPPKAQGPVQCCTR